MSLSQALTSVAGTAELCWIQIKVSTTATATATLNVFILGRFKLFNQVDFFRPLGVSVSSLSDFPCVMAECVKHADIYTHSGHCCSITGSTDMAPGMGLHHSLDDAGNGWRKVQRNGMFLSFDCRILMLKGDCTPFKWKITSI